MDDSQTTTTNVIVQQVPQQPQNNAFDDLLSNPTNITQ